MLFRSNLLTTIKACYKILLIKIVKAYSYRPWTMAKKTVSRIYELHISEIKTLGKEIYKNDIHLRKDLINKQTRHAYKIYHNYFCKHITEPVVPKQRVLFRKKMIHYIINFWRVTDINQYRHVLLNFKQCHADIMEIIARMKNQLNELNETEAGVHQKKLEENAIETKYHLEASEHLG